MGPRSPKYFAEAIGTFCLVFAGAGAVIVDGLSGGRLGHVGVSLVFGLAVMAMVYAIGHISGAHMNPAVTAGFLAAGRLGSKEARFYVLAQLAGAVLASATLRLVFPDSPALGQTLPSGAWAQSFALEAVLTFILMFVIMGVATDHRAQGVMAGAAIGAAVAMGALLGGPVSGASMNPARSFGPALLSGDFSFHWLYWLAPLAGACLGSRAYLAVQCERPSGPSKIGCC